jgi:hypothetical protein
MAYDFNGTSQYLNTASSPITNGPLTISCWVNLDNTAANRSFVTLNDANGQERFSLSVNPSANRSVQFAYLTSAGAIPFVAAMNAAPSAGIWYHASATVSGTGAGTTFAAYENGIIGELTQSGTLTVANNIDSVIIGSRYATSLGLFMDGKIAEVGIWSSALTQPEIASLARGMTCDKVRPQSLVFYAPLVRDLIDAKGALTITNNNGTTVANHPRIYP